MCLINTHLYISHCITAKPEVTKQIFIYESIPLKIYYRQFIIFYFSSYLLQTFLFDVQAWTLVMRRDRFGSNLGLFWLRTEQSFFISSFCTSFTLVFLPLNTVVCLRLVNYLVTFDTCLLCLASLPCTQKKQTNLRCIKSMSMCCIWPFCLQTFRYDLNHFASHETTAGFCDWKKAAFACP